MKQLKVKIDIIPSKELELISNFYSIANPKKDKLTISNGIAAMEIGVTTENFRKLLTRVLDIGIIQQFECKNDEGDKTNAYISNRCFIECAVSKGARNSFVKIFFDCCAEDDTLSIDGEKAVGYLSWEEQENQIKFFEGISSLERMLDNGEYVKIMGFIHIEEDYTTRILKKILAKATSREEFVEKVVLTIFNPYNKKKDAYLAFINDIIDCGELRDISKSVEKAGLNKATVYQTLKRREVEAKQLFAGICRMCNEKFKDEGSQEITLTRDGENKDAGTDGNTGNKTGEDVGDSRTDYVVEEKRGKIIENTEEDYTTEVLKNILAKVTSREGFVEQLVSEIFSPHKKNKEAYRNLVNNIIDNESLHNIRAAAKEVGLSEATIYQTLKRKGYKAKALFEGIRIMCNEKFKDEGSQEITLPGDGENKDEGTVKPGENIETTTIKENTVDDEKERNDEGKLADMAKIMRSRYISLFGNQQIVAVASRKKSMSPEQNNVFEGVIKKIESIIKDINNGKQVNGSQLVIETQKIKEYDLDLEQVKKIYNLLYSQEIKRVTEYEDIYNYIEKVKNNLATKFLKAVEARLIGIESLEEINAVRSQIPKDFSKNHSAVFYLIIDQINKKTNSIRDQERSNTKNKSIEQMLNDILSGEFANIEGRIAKEAQNQMQINNKSKFALNEEQRIKQIRHQLKQRILESSDKFNDIDTDAMFQGMQGVFGNSALELVIDILIKKGEFEKAKEMCNNLSEEMEDNGLLMKIESLRKKIRNEEISSRVVKQMEKTEATQQEDADFIIWLANKLKEEGAKPKDITITRTGAATLALLLSGKGVKDRLMDN